MVLMDQQSGQGNQAKPSQEKPPPPTTDAVAHRQGDGPRPHDMQRGDQVVRLVEGKHLAIEFVHVRIVREHARKTEGCGKQQKNQPGNQCPPERLLAQGSQGRRFHEQRGRQEQGVHGQVGPNEMRHERRLQLPIEMAAIGMAAHRGQPVHRGIDGEEGDARPRRPHEIGDESCPIKSHGNQRWPDCPEPPSAVPGGLRAKD